MDTDTFIPVVVMAC